MGNLCLIRNNRQNAVFHPLDIFLNSTLAMLGQDVR